MKNGISLPIGKEIIYGKCKESKCRRRALKKYEYCNKHLTIGIFEYLTATNRNRLRRIMIGRTKYYHKGTEEKNWKYKYEIDTNKRIN